MTEKQQQEKAEILEVVCGCNTQEIQSLFSLKSVKRFRRLV